MEIAGRFIGWWLTLPASAVVGILLVLEAARSYAALAVEEEYPEFGRLGESAAAAHAVDELERTAAEYASSREGSAVAAGGIMEAVLLLKKSRSERGLLVRESSEFEWVTVLALSVLAIIAIGIGHTDDSSMRITSWCLFIPAMVTVLGLLALRENPYRPPLSVSIAPLESAQSHLSLP